MRIRANNLNLRPTGPAVICVLNQSPWDVMSLSQLSEYLKIIEGDDRYFRESMPGNSAGEQKSSPAAKSVPKQNQSVEKVAKPPRRGYKRKEKEVDDKCDDDGIYDYYSGFGPKWKKRRGVVQNCKEAIASTSNFGSKGGNNDDDEKPLKERSLKSILEGVQLFRNHSSQAAASGIFEF